MKRITLTSLACTALLAATAPAFAPDATAATPNPNSAVVTQRVFNDCPVSTVTVVNNYPALLSIQDSGLQCFGFANLHTWSFSENGTSSAAFPNNSDFRVSTDLVISGTSNGEAGLRISPWWSKEVDGRFNVRTGDGEIACFGGRLPFFTFTGVYGLRYTKGEPIHLEITYKPNGLSEASPATIEYQLVYQGLTYTSGQLPFDMGNPNEDPPYGLWGMLNDGRVGGYIQPNMIPGNPAADLKASFTNICFVICPWERDIAQTLPQPTTTVINQRIFNDCPVSTVSVVNNYPSLVSIEDTGLQCFGFANLHNWTFADGSGPIVLNNGDRFRFSTDLKITGSSNGEAGLRLSPWWSKDVDGRFNVRTGDGEIACFGGRLPFFTFTGRYGLRYTKGEPIHLDVIYRPNGLSQSNPATIEYQLKYQGLSYTSGQLPFDQANPAEDPPHGLWGILNDARAGGYIQPNMIPGDPTASLKAEFTNIEFHAGVTVAVDVDPNTLNLRGGGRWVTVYIEPPAPYTASDIDVQSLRLNCVAGPEQVGSATIGDHDGDGIADLAVKFSRMAVSEFASDGLVVITGEVGGACFEGSDLVRVLSVHSPSSGSVLARGSTSTIRWQQVPGSSAAVHYSLDNGDSWTLVAQNLPNSGSYAWSVPDVTSSTARVAVVVDDGTEGISGISGQFSIDAVVGVGDGELAFGLSGTVPNPSKGGPLNVRFSLPSSKKATLALFDVSGRVLASREVGSLGAGRHVVSLAQRLPAGMYVVRLSQEGKSLSSRAHVVR